MNRVQEVIAARQDQFLAELSELLAFPSMSGDQAALSGAAQWIGRRLTSMGATVQMLDAGNGPDIVFGEVGTAGPSVLSYTHYDVQPPDPLELWESPPFTATVRDGHLFARGVGDDKGDTVARMQAIDVYRAVYGELPLRFKFFVEGEEEVGSPHLAPVAQRHAATLASDGALWEGGQFDEKERYTFYCGLKGIQYLELQVSGARYDLHSSYAPMVTNPAWRLVQALATLKDTQDRITIDGFAEHVRPPTAADLEYIRHIPFAGDQVKANWGIPGFVNNMTDEQALVRFLTEPTCTICGLRSGFIDPGEKTVLPSSALAKIDFRLVPDLTPELVLDLLRKHLDRHGFSDVKIVPAASTIASRSNVNAPVVKAAVDAARAIYGEPVVYPSHGGSGPMYPLVQGLGMDGIMVGVGYSGMLMHAPNENIRVADYFRHIEFLVEFIRRFVAKASEGTVTPPVA